MGANTENEIDFDEPKEIMEHVHVGPEDAEENLKLQQEAPGEDVSSSLLQADEQRTDSWLTWNKGLTNRGYSPAARLGTENVGSLEQVWSIELDSERVETTPVVVPSDPPVMYFTYGNVTVTAVNARTGETFWEYQTGGDPTDQNRGVAVMGDKVFVGTDEMELHALNRYTGEKVWTTSIMTDEQRETIPNTNRRLGFAHAPMAYNGLVYGGQHGDHTGWSVVWAVDADSGELAWAKRSAPKDQWVGDSWKYSSATHWFSPTIDPETNSLVTCNANPVPMYNAAVRPGPNRNSNSIVAYDLQSGETKWVHQIMPAEVWDADASTTPIIFDMKVDGEKRRIVRHDNKLGWTFYIDAETGDLLQRSRQWTWRGGELWTNEGLQYPPGTDAEPPSDEGEEVAEVLLPHEGTEWCADAHSPKTGLDYVGANNDGNWIWMNTGWEYTPDNFETNAGDHGPLREGIDTGYGEQWTEVAAIDPATGEKVWTYEHTDIDPSWGYIRLYQGGITATGGDLVFTGSAGGTLTALDAETGDSLWSDNAGDRIIAGPSVWDDPVDSRQYVSVAAFDKIVTYAGDGTL